MTIVIFLLTLFYCSILIRLYLGLRQLRRGTNSHQAVVSIVVAARNEEKNIADCLNALTAQQYPADKLEIIIVDDRSSDTTAEIVSRYQNANANVSLVRVTEISEQMAPKKHALSLGINRAQGEIIFITDADCTPSSGWIQSMIRYFENDVGLVAGFSPLDRFYRSSVLGKLITLDSLSLAALAAGSFGAGFPLTCNARNLAFRKSAYLQIGGYEEIGQLVSGDDDLFLHLLRQKTDWRMRYAIETEAVVPSNPPTNFKTFINQRIRHASKGRYYSLGMKLGLAAVYLFNVALFISFLLSFWNTYYLLLFAISFLLKSFTEFLLIQKMAAIIFYKKYLKYFPLAALLHIPYIVIFGLWGQLGKFSWKGELFHPELKPNSENTGNQHA